MTPAALAGVSPQVRSGRRGGWDRDSIITAIQEWVATYGEPPRAADWNPSSAKWSGQLWRVARYRAGRADGSPWPALNAAKRPFGGSLIAAVRAAGFAPARPGPVRRTDVDPAQAGRAVMSPEGRAMVAAALAQARAAERRVTLLEGRLARAAAARPEPAVTKTKVVRERVADDAAIARADRRAASTRAKADEQVAAARMDAAEARQTAKKLAARLERAEATIASLREERRELKTEVEQGSDRLVAGERMLARARAEAVDQAAPEVVTVREPAPGAAEVRAARTDAARARRAVADAEERVARAERELRETVAAIRGDPRRLTPVELAELRAGGPSGPAVMAQSVRALAAARADGDRLALRDALAGVARAAVTWGDRL